MENSEQQKQIIKLGKLIVKELNLDPGVDTLSRWMSHYIAEKITFAESLPNGKTKETAQKECFDLILKLWNHRWVYLNKSRPFKDFGKILDVLEKINPDGDNNYYSRVILDRQFPILKEETNIDSNAKSWIDVVVEIDKLVRIWIEYCLQQSVKTISKEKVDKWIKASDGLPKIKDVEVIKTLINFDSERSFSDEELKKFQKKQLEKRISELAKFNEVNNLILKSLKDDLDKIKK